MTSGTALTSLAAALGGLHRSSERSLRPGARRSTAMSAPDHLRSGAGSGATMGATILHADDSGAVRRWVAEHLSDPTLKVVSVADGQAALAELQKLRLALIVTD